jgi:hypothetical protein
VWVFLHGTQVTDKGLAHFKTCARLTELESLIQKSYSA